MCSRHIVLWKDIVLYEYICTATELKMILIAKLLFPLKLFPPFRVLPVRKEDGFVIRQSITAKICFFLCKKKFSFGFEHRTACKISSSWEIFPQKKKEKMKDVSASLSSLSIFSSTCFLLSWSRHEPVSEEKKKSETVYHSPVEVRAACSFHLVK